MSMARNNIGNRGFVSNERNSNDLFPIHGVAIGSNDITRGSYSGETKLWLPSVLEESADTLEGRKIVVNHENRDAREVIGEVTNAQFKEGTGVIYQGQIDDEELANKIDNGWLEVSPRILHSSEMEEREGVKIPQKIRKFDNLSVVSKGAAKSNFVDLGEHEELSVSELQEEFDSEDEDVISDWEESVSFEELQEDFDYSRWMFDNPEGAQGANQKFNCTQIHEHEIEGQTWYMPCGSHDKFLKQLDEVNTEAEEMQLEEARNPEYDGTEERSWGDIPADTLSYYVDELDLSADRWDELSQSEREEIAQHTLLGDPDDDTADGGIFFPVVNASNGDLNRGALEAVRSGRGQSADLSESTYKSAYETAGRLLNEEFDADVDVEFEGSEAEEMAKHKNTEMSKLASQLASHSELTKSESLDLVSSLNPSEELVNVDVLAKAVSKALGVDESQMRMVIRELSGHQRTEEEMQEDLRSTASVIADRDDFEGVDVEDVMDAFDGLRETENEVADSRLEEIFN